MKLVKLALFIVFATVPRLAANADEQTTGVSDLNRFARDSNYADVSDIPNVHVQLRYASDDNFLKKNLYGNFHRCFLHRTAAAKLRVAAADLESEPVDPRL